MCVCVAIICVLFDFDSARSVVAQQSCHWEERPLWSIVLCTEESYKLVTGKDWPGDGDSSVVLRKFQDGETRKVIAVTRGIKGAWEETCNFSFKESCVMPKDNGQLVFQDLQQQQTLNLKRMQIIWNKFLSVSALHMPSSLAFPPTLQVVQDELKGLTMLPFAPGLADTPGLFTFAFKEIFFDVQATSTTVMLALVGFSVISHEVVSARPGYVLIALLVVWQYGFAIIPFALRILLGFVFVVSFYFATLRTFFIKQPSIPSYPPSYYLLCYNTYY